MLERIEQSFFILKRIFRPLSFLKNLFIKDFVDDSLKNLYRHALKNNSTSLSNLLKTADRTQHPYASYLAAKALEKLKISSDLIQHYYFNAVQKGKTSSDIQQKKGALASAKILSSFYAKGKYVPRSQLFAEHYAYEAACIDKKSAKEFIKKTQESKAPTQKIRYLQTADVILTHLPLTASSNLDSEGVKDLALIEKYLNLAKESFPTKTSDYEKQLENKLYIALAERYKSFGMYTQALELYHKIHPQTPEHLPAVFEAANLSAYSLKNTQKAEQILKAALPEVRQEKEAHFFEYLKNWVNAWKNKEEKEKNTQDLERSFDEKTINPFREIYIYTSQGVTLMAMDLVEQRALDKRTILENDKVKGMTAGEFAIHIKKYKKESDFRIEIKKIIDAYKSPTYIKLNKLNKEFMEMPKNKREITPLHKMYIDRNEEIEALERVYEAGLMINQELNNAYLNQSIQSDQYNKNDSQASLSLVSESESSEELNFTELSKSYNFYTDVELINQCHLILNNDKKPIRSILDNGFINSVHNLLGKLIARKIRAYNNSHCVEKAIHLKNQVLIEKVDKKESVIIKLTREIKERDLYIKENGIDILRISLNKTETELQKTKTELEKTNTEFQKELQEQKESIKSILKQIGQIGEEKEKSQKPIEETTESNSLTSDNKNIPIPLDKIVGNLSDQKIIREETNNAINEEKLLSSSTGENKIFNIKYSHSSQFFNPSNDERSQKRTMKKVKQAPLLKKSSYEEEQNAIFTKAKVIL